MEYCETIAVYVSDNMYKTLDLNTGSCVDETFELREKCCLLENQIQQLNEHLEQIARIKRMHCFVLDEFRMVQTVEYLKSSIIGFEERVILFNELNKLFDTNTDIGTSTECLKYLIDMYEERGFCWNEQILEKSTGIVAEPVHYIVRCAGHQTIRYLVELFIKKKLSLETETSEGYRIIHLVCASGDYLSIKYLVEIFIELGLDLECETKHGWKPIHFISRYGCPETIGYIFDTWLKHNFDLECVTRDNEKLKPLNLISKHGSTEIFDYAVNIYKRKHNLKIMSYLMIGIAICIGIFS